MVIFHSYVKLPEGTCETWWFSTSQSVRVYQRLLKISQMVNVIFKYPPINPIKSKSPLNPNKFHFVLILPVVFFTCRNSEPRCQHQGMRLSFGWDRRVEWWCSRAKNTRVSETWGHCLTFVSIWKVIDCIIGVPRFSEKPWKPFTKVAWNRHSAWFFLSQTSTTWRSKTARSSIPCHSWSGRPTMQAPCPRDRVAKHGGWHRCF